MDKTKNLVFSLEGDSVTVELVYNDEIGKHIHEYPDFEKNPRWTALGKPWVNVLKEDCPFATGEFGDCGSCEFFRCEKDGDLIGICENENLLLLRKDA